MENKDYILSIDGSERRYLDTEVRADKDSRKVVGYAAVFNKDSENLGGFIERISPGAFDSVMKDDVVALLNHDQNFVLARNNKTLKISTDSVGLKYEFEAPNTTAGNDLIENLRLGNISKSSFAFTVEKDEWEFKSDGPDKREITKVKRLFDVSPVTYPAYPDTTVAQRSKDYSLKNQDNAQPSIETYNRAIKERRQKLNKRKL